jgi:Ca2+/Na+ antiporter
MVLLFGVAVFAQKAETAVISKASNIAGLFSLLCYSVFLFTSDTSPKKEEKEEEGALNPEFEKERPKYWRIAILEWFVFFSTILWFFVISMYALMK